ncbi:TerC family protein [Roseococcus sp. SYP-B2431]|uniref:TerC family protein n=1 Tax=Roseococcus sp. SYP-B2431 TaxID=2496640 RepID=UPI0010406E0D|nr:TerC family protein [Roseococcus sp. SYP-B2431]TCI00964.1 TerC family protein [Roseococcus sp. SYP-B2431]
MDSLMTLAADPAAWVALGTLIVMEVVLGIDNLLFISILTNKLPEHQRARARFIGIAAALVLRLALLSLVFVIVQLVEPVLTLFGQSFSWRDLILIGGGLFLVWKATKEIHHNVDPGHAPDVFDGGSGGSAVAGAAYAAIIGQILLLDLVFSLDSIITAVGMTDHIEIMVIAVVVTVAVMLFAANPLGNFIGNNPSVVMLALSFLLMIGMTLIAEGFGVKVPKGYVYAAMAFSAAVEALNMISRRASARKAASKGTARMPVRR